MAEDCRGEWVTAYVDASCIARKGAWSAWLRGSAQRHQLSGLCPRAVKTSTEAEFFAVYAAVFRATRLWGAELEGILVKSDCRGALAWSVRGARLEGKKRRVARRIHGRLWRLVDEAGIELDTAWVRGHQQPDAGVGAWLNHRVDRGARRTLLRGTRA